MSYDPAYLPLVAEEAAEIIQAITKIMRFGPEEINPHSLNQQRTNLETLALEVGDFLVVMEKLGLPRDKIAFGSAMKMDRLEKFGPHVWEKGKSYVDDLGR